jgi:hypothetical protein
MGMVDEVWSTPSELFNILYLTACCKMMPKGEIVESHLE